MSFDIFVQAFEHGEARKVDARALRRALAPYLIQVENGWNLRAGRATAEIYGVEKLGSGFTVTHVDGVDLYDVLVEIAAAFDLVIMPVGVPTAITRREQLNHLPDVLRDDALLVSSGGELLKLIESG